MKPWYTLMDKLNLHKKYFKGVDILTYYTPIDPTKDQESMLNKTLQKKWQPQKTVAQQLQLEKESEMKAKDRLKQGLERERAQKRGKKDQKLVRVMKKVPMTFYTCNANHITNKMATLAHDTMIQRLDVIHITEAGLKQQLFSLI